MLLRRRNDIKAANKNSLGLFFNNNYLRQILEAGQSKK